MALVDWPVTGLAVLTRSRAEPGRFWVPGRVTPDIGRPVAVRGLVLRNAINELYQILKHYFNWSPIKYFIILVEFGHCH